MDSGKCGMLCLICSEITFFGTLLAVYLFYIGKDPAGTPTPSEVLEVSAEIADMDDVRLKVYPNEPVWSLVGNTTGIKTKELSLQEGDAVTMWLETDLTESMIEVQQG